MSPPKERLIRLLLANPGSYVGYRTQVLNAQDMQIGKVAVNTVESLCNCYVLERVSRDGTWGFHKLKRPPVRFYLNTAAPEVLSILQRPERAPETESSDSVTMWDHLHDGLL